MILKHRIMIKVLLIACAFGLCVGIGRNPTVSDHACCQFRHASELTAAKNNQPNQNSRIEAYNIGITGFPCRTNCRIIVGRSTTNLGDTESPNYLQCGTGMYCFKGRCVVPPSTSVTDA